MKKLCHCQPMWAYSYNYPTWYGLIVSPMDWRSRIEIILNLNLNLEVDGLVSSALSAHVGPMFVQPALECIDRWRHHNVLRKPVPVCDYSVAERIFPDIATTSGDCDQSSGGERWRSSTSTINHVIITDRPSHSPVHRQWPDNFRLLPLTLCRAGNDYRP